MSRIKIPLLSLHSLDDPIVSTHYVPWDDVKKSEHIVFASTSGTRFFSVSRRAE